MIETHKKKAHRQIGELHTKRKARALAYCLIHSRVNCLTSTTHSLIWGKPRRALEHLPANCLAPNNDSLQVTNGVGPHVWRPFTAHLTESLAHTVNF